MHIANTVQGTLLHILLIIALLTMTETSENMPCVYVNHGGGPLPLLGHQPAVADFLTSFPQTFSTPTAILDTITVSNGERVDLLFDYGGFPEESYQYKYPAPGSPPLADKVFHMLKAADIPCKKDTRRGWDHGVFVPLMLMYPNASIPVVALSLHSSLDPALHINVGKALAQLREEGVLIVGSGASFHNFDYFFARDSKRRAEGVAHSHAWHNYLSDTITTESLTPEERERRLIGWASGPSARAGHKSGQEEHLIPLHVIAGAGGLGPGASVGTLCSADEIAIGNFVWK